MDEFQIFYEKWFHIVFHKLIMIINITIFQSKEIIVPI